MIRLQITQNNDGGKTIYYRDEDYVAIRVAHFDCNENLIKEELTEFNQKKEVLTSVIYAGDSQTVLGYRQYYYDQDSDKNEKVNFEDFKLIDGELRKVCKSTSHLIEEGHIKKLKCTWYNGNDEFLFYHVYEDEYAGGDVNSFLYHYDQNDQRIEYGSREVEIYCR